MSNCAKNASRHSSVLTIAVTTGIVLTMGGCNSALAAAGGRESKPWLISAGKLSTEHHAHCGGLTYKGEKMKVEILTGALSNPRSLVMRCSEQFLFLL